MEDDARIKKARSMTLRFLTYRARSVKEVEDYLEKKGFSGEAIEFIVGEMKGYRYLDDHRFAGDYALSRKLRGFGIKKIRHDLFLKGIEGEIVEKVLAEHFSADDDLTRIKELVKNRNNKSDSAWDERRFRREAAFLQRRGFQDDLIVKALKAFVNSDYD